MRFPFILLAVIVPLSTQAASFDCAKASHPLEKTICADTELSALDEKMAKTYAQKRAQLFDRESLRVMQSNWQAVLRNQCKQTCDRDRVKTDYLNQIAAIGNVMAENYEANYKTNDISILDIIHYQAGGFGISLRREYLDEPSKALCQFPAAGGEASAKMTIDSPDKAHWTDGHCTVTIAFRRGAKGSVHSIDITSTGACNRYCPTSNFVLDDRNFIPNNSWVAGNQ